MEVADWQLVLAALIGGVIGARIGALTTTLARGANEREQHLRDRMVTAADEFATGLRQATISVNAARGAAVTHGTTDESSRLRVHDPATAELVPEISDAINRAGAVVDEAHARLPRVQLLFGYESPAAAYADESIGRLRATLRTLQEWPYADLAGHMEAFDRAHKLQGDFCTAAADAIRPAPRWKRWPGIRHLRRSWPLRRSVGS